MSPSLVIDTWSPADLEAGREALHALVHDAVASNASVGYVWPLDEEQVAKSWQAWIDEAARGERHVFVARLDGEVAGCVHLVPCGKPNQQHRADVAKLLVHRRFQRRGVARALMGALEARALALGRTLLTLDTRSRAPADTLYRRLGWTPFGVVPGFACDPDGVVADCTFFYKALGS